MKKRNLIVGTVMLALAPGGAGFWLLNRPNTDATSPYRTGVVTTGIVESTVTSTGILHPMQSVAIGTQVSGRVVELRADYNDRVRKGELLARIDPTIQEQQLRNAQASLDRAQAALEQAEYTFRQNQTLFQNHVITETEFNQAQYNYTVARSNLVSAQVSLDQAEQNLSYTNVYSPIDGIVIERNVELGQTVAASLSAPQLYLLASDLGEMEILADVDESEIGRIETGMPVRFSVQAYPNASFEGTVRQVRLASVNQQNVVNYTAVISVENPGAQLLPGMTANVDFIVQRAENVFVVPNAALRFRPTEEMIAQLTDSTMIRIARSTGSAGRAAAGSSRPSTESGSNGTNGRQGTGLAAAAGTTRGTTGDSSAIAVAAVRESFAPLWYIRDGKLGVIRVRTGISDQTNTEIYSDGLEEGMEIIIGLAVPQATQVQTTNPFQQQVQPMPGGGGAFGGPGRGG